MVLMLAGCDGCQTPSQRFIYRLACDAMLESGDVPADARPLPLDEARIGIGKNAASVDVPYEYAADGQKTVAWHTVWFRRVARTWTVSRMNPTPVYPAPAAQ
jgi:hypothetical protein